MNTWPTMRYLRVLIPIILAVLPLMTGGCKKTSSTDASRSLQQSFQAAEPQTKQEIQTAVASLNTGSYIEATRALQPIVSKPNLTEAQKQAVGLALQQINQAIAQNPSLDTKEMYELRRKMFQAVDGGKRF